MNINYMHVEFESTHREIAHTNLILPRVTNNINYPKNYDIVDSFYAEKKILQQHILYLTNFSRIDSFSYVPKKKIVNLKTQLPHATICAPTEIKSRFTKIDERIKKYKIKLKNSRKKIKLKKSLFRILYFGCNRTKTVKQKYKRLLETSKKNSLAYKNNFQYRRIKPKIKKDILEKRNNNCVIKCFYKLSNLYMKAYKKIFNIFYKWKVVKLEKNIHVYISYYTDFTYKNIQNTDTPLKNIFSEDRNLISRYQKLYSLYLYEYNKSIIYKIYSYVPNNISLYSSTVSEIDTESTDIPDDHSLIFNMNKLRGYEELYLYIKDNFNLQEGYYNDNVIFSINGTVCFYEDSTDEILDFYKEMILIKDINLNKKVIRSYITKYQ